MPRQSLNPAMTMLPAPVHAEASPGGSDTGNAAAPIDMKHLARYTFGDVSLEEEILGLFCTQAADLFRQMKGACSTPEWRFATHSLKGSARAVGAWAVAELAAEAEHCAAQSNTAADLIEQIETELAAVRAFVAQAYPASLKQPA